MYVFVPFVARVITQRHDSGILYPLIGTFRVVISDLILLLITWIAACILMAIPFLFLHWFIRRVEIRSIFFYLLVGAVAGAFAAMVGSRALTGVSWYSDISVVPTPSNFYDFLKVLAPAGVFSGFIYWMIAGRHVA